MRQFWESSHGLRRLSTFTVGEGFPLWITLRASSTCSSLWESVLFGHRFVRGHCFPYASAFLELVVPLSVTLSPSNLRDGSSKTFPARRVLGKRRSVQAPRPCSRSSFPFGSADSAKASPFRIQRGSKGESPLGLGSGRAFHRPRSTAATGFKRL